MIDGGEHGCAWPAPRFRDTHEAMIRQNLSERILQSDPTVTRDVVRWLEEGSERSCRGALHLTRVTGFERVSWAAL